MQTGNLVITCEYTSPDRIGLVEGRAMYTNCFVVRFFDGKSPSEKAYHRDKLRILSRRDDGR